eukprot:Pgem_evm1s18478
MSASFITCIPNYAPDNKVRKHVPICFLPTSLVALISVHKLDETVDSPNQFGFWLKLLHVVLVLPSFIAYCLPKQPRVDPAVIFGLLAVLVTISHCSISKFEDYSWPVSDCQVSIELDLLFCCMITIYAIYNAFDNSPLCASVALVLTPILTPVVNVTVKPTNIAPQNVVLGSVLACYLVLERLSSIHSSVVTHIQKEFSLYLRNGRSQGERKKETVKYKKAWMNLGRFSMLENVTDYDEACENLATCLSEGTSFEQGDGVLCCGCGFGSELVYWKNEYHLGHITGIDLNEEAVKSFSNMLLHNVRLLKLNVRDILKEFGNKSCFNRVVALDSVYHFADKVTFFKDAFALLT